VKVSELIRKLKELDQDSIVVMKSNWMEGIRRVGDVHVSPINDDIVYIKDKESE
jgi:hypothetical protein